MTARFPVMLGDTLRPLNVIISDDTGPLDLSAYTVKILLKDKDNAVVLNDVTTGVTANPTQAFTVDTSLDLILKNNHGVKNGDRVILASTTTIPAGLAVATRYYAIECTQDSFKVTTLPTGTAIDITSAGTGTHTFYVVGSVQMDFASTETDAVGPFKAWFRLFSGSEVDTFPKDSEGIPVDVKALGN